jgi:hypothetical protein
MKKKNKKEPARKYVNSKTKPYTIVKFDFDKMPKEYHKGYPFKEFTLYLGEIEHMPGHGVFVNKDGKVLWGYHLDEFYIVPEEEI